MTAMPKLEKRKVTYLGKYPVVIQYDPKHMEFLFVRYSAQFSRDRAFQLAVKAGKGDPASCVLLFCAREALTYTYNVRRSLSAGEAIRKFHKYLKTHGLRPKGFHVKSVAPMVPLDPADFEITEVNGDDNDG